MPANLFARNSPCRQLKVETYTTGVGAYTWGQGGVDTRLSKLRREYTRELRYGVRKYGVEGAAGRGHSVLSRITIIVVLVSHLPSLATLRPGKVFGTNLHLVELDDDGVRLYRGAARMHRFPHNASQRSTSRGTCPLRPIVRRPILGTYVLAMLHTKIILRFSLPPRPPNYFPLRLPAVKITSHPVVGLDVRSTAATFRMLRRERQVAPKNLAPAARQHTWGLGRRRRVVKSYRR